MFLQEGGFLFLSFNLHRFVPLSEKEHFEKICLMYWWSNLENLEAIQALNIDNVNR